MRLVTQYVAVGSARSPVVVRREKYTRINDEIIDGRLIPGIPRYTDESPRALYIRSLVEVEQDDDGIYLECDSLCHNWHREIMNREAGYEIFHRGMIKVLCMLTTGIAGDWRRELSPTNHSSVSQVCELIRLHHMTLFRVPSNAPREYSSRDMLTLGRRLFTIRHSEEYLVLSQAIYTIAEHRNVYLDKLEKLAAQLASVEDQGDPGENESDQNTIMAHSKTHGSIISRSSTLSEAVTQASRIVAQGRTATPLRPAVTVSFSEELARSVVRRAARVETISDPTNSSGSPTRSNVGESKSVRRVPVYLNPEFELALRRRRAAIECGSDTD